MNKATLNRVRRFYREQNTKLEATRKMLRARKEAQQAAQPTDKAKEAA